MAARAAPSSVPSHSPAGIPWWELPADGVAARLGSDPHAGLAPGQAAQRLSVEGPNELVAVKARPVWRLFAAQFASTAITLPTGRPFSQRDWLVAVLPGGSHGWQGYSLGPARRPLQRRRRRLGVGHWCRCLR